MYHFNFIKAYQAFIWNGFKSVQVTLMLTRDWCEVVNTNVPMIFKSCVPYPMCTSLSIISYPNWFVTWLSPSDLGLDPWYHMTYFHTLWLLQKAIYLKKKAIYNIHTCQARTQRVLKGVQEKRGLQAITLYKLIFVKILNTVSLIF